MSNIDDKIAELERQIKLLKSLKGFPGAIDPNDKAPGSIDPFRPSSIPWWPSHLFGVKCFND